MGNHELNPQHGVFRWARSEAARHRATFAWSTVVLSVIVVVVGAVFTQPEDPSAVDRIINGVLGLFIAVGIMVVVAFLYALLIAPYQQRNALRRQLAAAQAGSSSDERIGSEFRRAASLTPGEHRSQLRAAIEAIDQELAEQGLPPARVFLGQSAGDEAVGDPRVEAVVQLLAQGRSILAQSPVARRRGERTTSVTSELDALARKWFTDTREALRPWPLHRESFELVTDRSFPGGSDLPQGWHLSLERRIDALQAIVDGLTHAPPASTPAESFDERLDALREVANQGTALLPLLPEPLDGVSSAVYQRFIEWFARAGSALQPWPRYFELLMADTLKGPPGETSAEDFTRDAKVRIGIVQAAWEGERR